MRIGAVRQADAQRQAVVDGSNAGVFDGQLHMQRIARIGCSGLAEGSDGEMVAHAADPAFHLFLPFIGNGHGFDVDGAYMP